MQIYLDLDTNRLVIGPGNAGLVGGYATPRGSGPLLRVQPVQGGQLVALPDDFEMTWTVKAEDDWGGTILAYADDFVQEAGTTVYACAVNYETTALDALLDIGETPEKESVALIAQLAWRADSAAVWRPTQVVDLHLHNSVWRGVPGAPEITPDSFDWLVAALVNAAGISFTVNTEAETITIGLALNAGTGLTVTTDAGNKIVAQDVQYALATADQDFFGGDGTNGTYADDDTLEVALAVNAVYDVTFHTRFLPNYAPASPSEHSAQWVLPTGAAVKGSWQTALYDSSLSVARHLQPNAAMSTEIGIISSDSSTEELGVTNHCLIQTGGTAGTAKLQFRCNFDDLTRKITRLAGSYLIARRIS